MKSNKNYKTFKFLRSQGYSFQDSVSFLLRVNNSSQLKIAKILGVKPPFVSQVVRGQRKTTRIQQAISKTLGFDPWII